MPSSETELSQKKMLRATMLERRKALKPDFIKTASTAIAHQITSLPLYQSASVVCSYMAFGQEVQTAEIIRTALADGKRVVLPRTHFAERRLSLHEVHDLDDLIAGRYGILEPAPESPQVDPKDVDLFLIPGSAFDARGGRLGYGAGFYDNLLHGCRGWQVALAYALQLTPHVPTDDHDIPIHVIVTERGIIDCVRGRQAGDHLRLNNIQCYGYHGAFAEERERGLRLAFDVDLRLDLQVPGLTDELSTTVNYPAIYALVSRIQSAQSFTLLESLAEQIAREIIQEFPSAHEATVRVRKFDPPIGGLMDTFEVEITRSRAAWIKPVLQK